MAIVYRIHLLQVYTQNTSICSFQSSARMSEQGTMCGQ